MILSKPNRIRELTFQFNFKDSRTHGGTFAGSQAPSALQVTSKVLALVPWKMWLVSVQVYLRLGRGERKKEKRILVFRFGCWSCDTLMLGQSYF